MFYHHTYASDRAYLLTSSNKFFYTTNGGKKWFSLEGPLVPNTFGAPVLSFHPNSDNLLWNGNNGCTGLGENCHGEAYYSRDNGRNWRLVETYVRNCAWARDADLKIDATQILCESYKNKQGSQRFFGNENPLELVSGTGFFSKKTKLFDHVVGFAKFSEYLVVAEVSTIALNTSLLVHVLHRKSVLTIASSSGTSSLIGWAHVFIWKIPPKHAP